MELLKSRPSRSTWSAITSRSRKAGIQPADGRSRASSDFKAEEREHGKGVELNHLLTYDPQCVEPARLKICA